MEKWGGFLVKNVDTGRTDNMLAGAWRTLGGLQSTSKAQVQDIVDAVKNGKLDIKDVDLCYNVPSIGRSVPKNR